MHLLGSLKGKIKSLLLLRLETIMKPLARPPVPGCLLARSLQLSPSGLVQPSKSIMVVAEASSCPNDQRAEDNEKSSDECQTILKVDNKTQSCISCCMLQPQDADMSLETVSSVGWWDLNK